MRRIEAEKWPRCLMARNGWLSSGRVIAILRVAVKKTSIGVSEMGYYKRKEEIFWVLRLWFNVINRLSLCSHDSGT